MSIALPASFYQDESYNNLRRGYLILIASLLEEYLIEGDINDHLHMIVAIEKSCYDHSVEIAEYELLNPDFSNVMFEQLYRTRIMRITKNLDINSEVSDEYLATGLLDGSIEPTKVSKMENKELSPLRNEKLFDLLNERLNQKMTLKTSTLYKCRQCGHKETTIRSVQMRSLDEGESLIIQCQFCHFKWFN